MAARARIAYESAREPDGRGRAPEVRCRRHDVRGRGRKRKVRRKGLQRINNLESIQSRLFFFLGESDRAPRGLPGVWSQPFALDCTRLHSSKLACCSQVYTGRDRCLRDLLRPAVLARKPSSTLQIVAVPPPSPLSRVANSARSHPHAGAALRQRTKLVHKVCAFAVKKPSHSPPASPRSSRRIQHGPVCRPRR